MLLGGGFILKVKRLQVMHTNVIGDILNFE